MKGVSVVVPFWNERAVLAETTAKLADYLRRAEPDWEVILVDDGSTDGSAESVRSLVSSEPRIRVLSCGGHLGRGSALKTGIEAARGEFVLTTEADLSWGTDTLRRALEALRAAPEASVVLASPHRAGGGYQGVPRRRVWLSRAANRLIRLLVGWPITMSTGMTRAYRRSAFGPIPSTRGKEWHLAVLLELYRSGSRIVEIPAQLRWSGDRGGRAMGQKGGFLASAAAHVRLAVGTAAVVR